VHSGEKPYACDFCDYRASKKSDLNSHLRVHSGEKPHACHFCDYRASEKSHLTRHLRVHTGEKPHACHFCDYRASEKSHLTRHLRVHTGEKPHACHFCDYRASEKSHITRHLRVHKSISASATVISSAHTAIATAEEEIGEEMDELAADDESSECAICLDDRTAFTCIPCGHQCVRVADGCTAAILGRWRCPVCDQGVTDLMHADKAAAVQRAGGRRVYHC